MQGLDLTLQIRDRNVETAMEKVGTELEFSEFKVWAEMVCADAMNFDVASRIAHDALVTAEHRGHYEILRWVCPNVERYVRAIERAGLSRPPDPEEDRSEGDVVVNEADASADNVNLDPGVLDDCLREVATVFAEWEPLLAPVDWANGPSDDELLSLVEPMYPGGQRLDQAPCPVTDLNDDEAIDIMLAVADDTGPGVSGWLRWLQREEELGG